MAGQLSLSHGPLFQLQGMTERHFQFPWWKLGNALLRIIMREFYKQRKVADTRWLERMINVIYKCLLWAMLIMYFFPYYILIILCFHSTCHILPLQQLLTNTSYSPSEKELCCIYLCIPLVVSEVLSLQSGGKRFAVFINICREPPTKVCGEWL